MFADALAMLKTEEERNELSEFYKENKNRLYAIAFSRLHNRESAEDAVQETFLRIAAKPERFFSISRNKRTAYADVIIRNVATDMYKAANKSAKELPDDLCSEDIPFEDKIIGEISRSELIKIILELPPRQRDILELKAVRGLENSEIAQRLGITENDVRQRIFQARKTIAKKLGDGER